MSKAKNRRGKYLIMWLFIGPNILTWVRQAIQEDIETQDFCVSPSYTNLKLRITLLV